MRKKQFSIHNQMLDGFAAPLKSATDDQLKYALEMCGQLPGGPDNRFMGNHKELFKMFIWVELKRRANEDRFSIARNILLKFKRAAKTTAQKD